jgi:hypothetical protein
MYLKKNPHLGRFAVYFGRDNTTGGNTMNNLNIQNLDDYLHTIFKLKVEVAQKNAQLDVLKFELDLEKQAMAHLEGLLSINRQGA